MNLQIIIKEAIELKVREPLNYVDALTYSPET